MVTTDYIYISFSRQGFSVALEPVLELALAEKADLELTEIHQPIESIYIFLMTSFQNIETEPYIIYLGTD